MLSPILDEIISHYRVVLFNEVSSTQDIIKDYLADEHKVLILARKQTCGRGRNLNAPWEAPSNSSLLCSILINLPNNSYNQQFPGNLTSLASLALHNLLFELNIESVIKYPNDVLIKDICDSQSALKKVAGVLGELICEDENYLTYSLGLGLNIFQEENQLPQNPLYSAGSLKSLHVLPKHFSEESYDKLIVELALKFAQHLNCLLNKIDAN